MSHNFLSRRVGAVNGLGSDHALKSHLNQLYKLGNFLLWRLVFLDASSHYIWPAAGANMQVQDF